MRRTGEPRDPRQRRKEGPPGRLARGADGGPHCRISAQTHARQTIEALRESEGKFRDLTEKSLVGVYLIQDNVFRYVNPRFTEIHGYEAEEMVDRISPQSLVLPEDW